MKWNRENGEKLRTCGVKERRFLMMGDFSTYLYVGLVEKRFKVQEERELEEASPPFNRYSVLTTCRALFWVLVPEHWMTHTRVPPS